MSDILNQNMNVSAWQSLVNRMLDLPAWQQFLINESMQILKYPVSNKHQPWFKWVMIPNIKDSTGALRIAEQVLTEQLSEWMKPNLGGIVINATSETQGRDIDVAENMIIVQGSTNISREYTTDNSAPHLRTWQIEGYLSQAIPWIDEHFILRPTLVAQQLLLDAYATSRKPVLYRSALCPVPTKVLIESYQLGAQVEGNNAYTVTLTLREFLTYTVPFYNKSGIDASYIDGTTGVREAFQELAGPPLPGV